MSVPMGRFRAIVLVVAALMSASALAAEKGGAVPLLPGSNSKDPISIDADKLEYFDKEQKAIYTGNVVAIQGDSKLTCSVMTLFLAKSEPSAAAGKPAAAPAPAAAGAPAGPGAGGGTQVKHMDAAGPVTVVSKTQVATGDRGSYDKDQNKVWLFGNVTLSDGGNVTKGDKLTYDLTSGTAVVEASAQAGKEDKAPARVHGVFIPGSNNPASDATNNTPAAPAKSADTNGGQKAKAKPKPKTPAE
jgi:lipopolysaccharide export system protein LptA